VSKTQIYRGTRDHYRAEYFLRKWAQDTIVQVFELFGFEPLETPMIEREDTFTGKYGQEGETRRFKLSLPYPNEAGLRYDHTVPLARFMAMNWNKVRLPYRRYVTGPVFRNETVQAGRLRQFNQCDFDTVGSSSPIVDAEVVAMNHMVLAKLGFTRQFKVAVNDRRLLSALAGELGYNDPSLSIVLFRAWDKLDKVTPGEAFDYFVEELLRLEDPNNQLEGDDRKRAIKRLRAENQTFPEATSQLYGLSDRPSDIALSEVARLYRSPETRDSVKRMDQLLGLVSSMGVPEGSCQFSPSLARGLAYYTGPIFETVVTEARIGSVTGGGRFDNLIKELGGPNLPASGSSFGLERLLDVMEKLELTPKFPASQTDVYSAMFDPDDTELCAYTFDVVHKLRLTGIRVEVYTGAVQRLSKQLEIANTKDIQLVLIIGPDEMQSGSVTYKVLSTGTQRSVAKGNIVDELANLVS